MLRAIDLNTSLSRLTPKDVAPSDRWPATASEYAKRFAIWAAKKTKVGDFEHLVIHSSIIRPAANEFIREYVRRLHGGEWEPIHP